MSSAVNEQLHQATDAGRVQESDPTHIENNLFRFDLAHLLKEGTNGFEAKLAVQAGDESSIVTGLLKDIQFGRMHELKEYRKAYFGSTNDVSQKAAATCSVIPPSLRLAGVVAAGIPLSA